MTDVAVGIKDLLVTAGVGVFGGTTGWAIYLGKEPPKPDTVITINKSGGLNSNPKWLLDFPSVQVMIRGPRSDYTQAESKAQEVKDALIGLPSQDLNGDRWVSVTGLGDILPGGRDDNDRTTVFVNLSLIIEPATNALTNRIPL